MMVPRCNSQFECGVTNDSPSANGARSLLSWARNELHFAQLVRSTVDAAQSRRRPPGGTTGKPPGMGFLPAASQVSQFKSGGSTQAPKRSGSKSGPFF
jgi:hypothetical protein